MFARTAVAAARRAPTASVSLHGIRRQVPRVVMCTLLSLAGSTPHMTQFGAGGLAQPSNTAGFADAAPSGPPPIKPFAVMRLAHEAVRAILAELDTAAQAAADAVGDDAAVASAVGDAAAALRELHSLVDIHMRQEEERFFPFLDAHFDGAATNAGFNAEHSKDDADKALIGAMLLDDDGAAAKADPRNLAATVGRYVAEHEQHLKHEEDIMMPLTEKAADTVEGRGAVVQSIWTVDEAGFADAMLPIVLRKLEATKPFGPVMMYVKALQMSASPAQYERLLPVIETSLSAETFAQLVAKGADGPGKQPEGGAEL